jgi:hypothetical protein
MQKCLVIQKIAVSLHCQFNKELHKQFKFYNYGSK